MKKKNLILFCELAGVDREAYPRRRHSLTHEEPQN